MNKREIMAAGELYMGHCFEKSVPVYKMMMQKKKKKSSLTFQALVTTKTYAEESDTKPSLVLAKIC